MIASLGAAARSSGLETILRRWRSEDLTNVLTKDTEDLVDKETLDLQEALDTIEEDIQETDLPKADVERVSNDVSALSVIINERMDELKEQLREQEMSNKRQAAKQESRAFWMDFGSNGLFFFLGLGVSVFTGLGGA